MVEGERLKVERAALLNANTSDEASELDVHMHHGKKREIRLLFTTLGYDVKRLRRYQIGAFQVKGFPLRAMKQLTPKEIDMLFKNPPTPHATHEAYARPAPADKSLHED
jgi:23S rRNA pseudouridine2605 synthase